MSDRVLITTDDLEQAVRVNAALEQAGFDTAMVSSLDDVRQAVRTPEQGAGSREPDAIVLTGGLHETTGQRLVAAAHEHGVPTLGLVEATDEAAETVGHGLGLTDWLVEPADPAKGPATVRRQFARRRVNQRTRVQGGSAPNRENVGRTHPMVPVK